MAEPATDEQRELWVASLGGVALCEAGYRTLGDRIAQLDARIEAERRKNSTLKDMRERWNELVAERDAEKARADEAEKNLAGWRDAWCNLSDQRVKEGMQSPIYPANCAALLQRIGEVEQDNRSLMENDERLRERIAAAEKEMQDRHRGYMDASERIAALERITTAVTDWLEREWKALSKSPSGIHGQRAAALTILEADIEEARGRGEVNP